MSQEKAGLSQPQEPDFTALLSILLFWVLSFEWILFHPNECSIPFSPPWEKKGHMDVVWKRGVRFIHRLSAAHKFDS